MIDPAKNPYCRHHERGFALVVTLSLMILLTIIAVGILTLSTISLRSSSQSEAMASARANARLALMLAIGDLQKEAGPDQRITARAEILDALPTTPAVDGVKQTHWTGVWKTGKKPTEDQRTESIGTNRSQSAHWLVSNPSPNASPPPDPASYSGTTDGNAPNAVILAKNLGIDGSEVTVPLVKVPGTTGRPGGSYAYWVGDEGIKTKANLVDPTFASGQPAIDQLHHMAPHANAMHKVLPMATLGTDFRTSPSASIAKLITADTVKLLPTVAMTGPLARYSPDFTVASQGVIADVRNGGLKKDLTAALENPAAFANLLTNHGNGASMLYRYSNSIANVYPTVPSGDQTAQVGITDGLRWHSLYFHYNAYKGQMPAPVATTGTTVAPTSSGNPATMPNALSPRAYGVKLGGISTKLGGILPQPIALRVDMAISSYNANPGGVADWRLRLHYYPQLVLYNPYSVRISASNYQLRRAMQAFISGSVLNKLTITSTTGGVQTVWPAFHISQVNRLNLQTKLGECATLDPGETRVFGLDADAPKSKPGDAITFPDLVSNANMSPDFSQYCDVSTDVDISGNNKTPFTPFSTSDPNTVIMVSLANRELNCGAIDTYCFPSGYKWPDNDGNLPIQTGGQYDQAAAAASWPTSLTIKQMDGAPRRIIGFYIRQKGLQPSGSTYSYANAAAQIPIFHGNHSDFNSMEDITSYIWKEVYLSPLGSLYQNGQTDVQIAHPPGSTQFWETSFGSQSAGVGPPGNRTILRDVPSQPLVSLGQFMHMPALNFRMTRINGATAYGFFAPGSMFVGGSLASPVVPTTQNAIITSIALYLDDSYLANQALFDQFFFSTVPPASLSAPSTTYPAYWTAFNAANSGSTLADHTKPLLNNRLKPYYKNGTAPQMASLRDVDKAAANLLLDGAFNVNSTSAGAWKALLGSLSGNELRLFNATGGSPTTLNLGTGKNKNPIPRFWSASASATPNAPWDGLRVLSDDEVDELAKRIVEQVKIRGPFLSMADFLNRRLGANSPLTLAGTLQAAIDNTSPDINAAAKAAGTTVSVSGGSPALLPGNLKDAKGNPLNTAVGMPGYLMQQDLVQAFSPAMTVRSDTFVIRTSGQALDASGKVIARAYAEAVVQRTPEFLDNTVDAAETGLANLTSEINKTFGRRFAITSFRWLSPNEL